jgi:hypothetical protein
LWLRVRATSGGIVFHEAQNYGTGATLLHRATESIGTPPFPFGAWRVPITETPPQVGLANSLRVDEFSQRRGGAKKTGGKGAVALRFDHGLNNFDSVIRPLLEARNLPYSLALNSRNWSTAENNTVTAAMVDGWTLAEIWNHGAHHNDATVYATQYDTIVTGLAELRAQLPSKSIDGFIVPGVGGTNYGGFSGGQNPASFYSTDAGRLILEHHAVSTGAYPNTDHRVLDGRIRQGMGHYTIEAQTPAAVIAEIDAAIAGKTGLQLMMHPSLIKHRRLPDDGRPNHNPRLYRHQRSIRGPGCP